MKSLKRMILLLALAVIAVALRPVKTSASKLDIVKAIVVALFLEKIVAVLILVDG